MLFFFFTEDQENKREREKLYIWFSMWNMFFIFGREKTQDHATLIQKCRIRLPNLQGERNIFRPLNCLLIIPLFLLLLKSIFFFMVSPSSIPNNQESYMKHDDITLPVSQSNLSVWWYQKGLMFYPHSKLVWKGKVTYRLCVRAAEFVGAGASMIPGISKGWD